MKYIKEGDHKGKKKLQDNTRSIIEGKKKNQELGRKTFLRHLS